MLDTRIRFNENHDASAFIETEEIAKILPRLSTAARQRIFGAVKYAEMVEVEMGATSNVPSAAVV